MDISLSIPDDFMITNHGYGVVSEQIVHALQRLGYRVPYRDPSAQVELAIGQPFHWVWSNPRRSHKIGLAAWESTDIPDRWLPWMRTADEIWATSPWVASVFEAAGFPVAKVFEHGIDTVVWSPKARVARKPLRFLHMGEPAPRKGGQMTYDAFRETFGDSDEATLTIKAHSMSTIRGRNNAHPWKESKNVKVVTDEMPEWQLVDLVRRHDVLVYPSWGEGFGLIPLQAMATGMPTICTGAWASYRNFILPGLRLESTQVKSPWKGHPGLVFKPDYDDLVHTMRYTADNFTDLAARSMELVPHIQRKYNWDRLTYEAFKQYTPATV